MNEKTEKKDKGRKTGEEKKEEKEARMKTQGTKRNMARETHARRLVTRLTGLRFLSILSSFSFFFFVPFLFPFFVPLSFFFSRSIAALEYWIKINNENENWRLLSEVALLKRGGETGDEKKRKEKNQKRQGRIGITKATSLPP